jgi:hypothetical protein
MFNEKLELPPEPTWTYVSMPMHLRKLQDDLISTKTQKEKVNKLTSTVIVTIDRMLDALETMENDLRALRRLMALYALATTVALVGLVIAVY